MRGSQMEAIDILNLFDFKDPDQVVGTRIQTVVPTQTLYLMNCPSSKTRRLLADRLLKDKDADDAARVSTLMLDALNRPATERDIHRRTSSYRLPGEREAKAATAAPESWARYCHAILVSSEFLYRR